MVNWRKSQTVIVGTTGPERGANFDAGSMVGAATRGKTLETGLGVSALQDQFLTTTTLRTGQEASEATRASLQLLVDVREAQDWKKVV